MIYQIGRPSRLLREAGIGREMAKDFGPRPKKTITGIEVKIEGQDPGLELEIKDKGEVPATEASQVSPGQKTTTVSTSPTSAGPESPEEKYPAAQAGQPAPDQEDQEQGLARGQKKQAEQKKPDKIDQAKDKSPASSTKTAKPAAAKSVPAAKPAATAAGSAGKAAAGAGAKAAAAAAESATGVGAVLVAAQTIWEGIKGLGKYWKPIAVIVAVLAILAMAAIYGLFGLKGFGGQGAEDPLDLNSAEAKGALALANRDPEVGKDTNKEAQTRDEEVIKAIKTYFAKMPKGVIGEARLQKNLQLLKEYEDFSKEVQKIVETILDKRLTLKEKLSDEEMKELDQLEKKFQELMDKREMLIAKMKKEFTYCQDYNQTNEQGFVRLPNYLLDKKYTTDSAFKDADLNWGQPILICFIKEVLQKANSQGLDLRIGDLSREQGGIIMGYMGGHEDGLSVTFSAPGLVPRSKEVFKVEYDRNKARAFAKLLWDSGAGQVYLNDSQLYSQKNNSNLYKNIFGDPVWLVYNLTQATKSFAVTLKMPYDYFVEAETGAGK